MNSETNLYQQNQELSCHYTMQLHQCIDLNTIRIDKNTNKLERSESRALLSAIFKISTEMRTICKTFLLSYKSFCHDKQVQLFLFQAQFQARLPKRQLIFSNNNPILPLFKRLSQIHVLYSWAHSLVSPMPRQPRQTTKTDISTTTTQSHTITGLPLYHCITATKSILSRMEN